MKLMVWKYLWTAILVGTLSHVALAQMEESEEKEDPELKKFTRFAIPDGTGIPGQAVIMPIYFTPQQGVEVGKVKIEVTFVSANLKFDKVERGLAAEMADLNLTSEAKPGKNDKGVETTTVTIQTSSAEPLKQGIHSGVLGYMTLKVSESGRPAVITLRTSAEALDLKLKPLQNVKIPEGRVEVFAPGTQPQVACFFFSH